MRQATPQSTVIYPRRSSLIRRPSQISTGNSGSMTSRWCSTTHDTPKFIISSCYYNFKLGLEREYCLYSPHHNGILFIEGKLCSFKTYLNVFIPLTRQVRSILIHWQPWWIKGLHCEYFKRLKVRFPVGTICETTFSNLVQGTAPKVIITDTR